MPGQMIALIAHQCLIHTNALNHLGIRGKIREEITANARTAVNADAPVVTQRVVTSTLQRFPRAFEKQPVLWICNLRLARIETKERTIKQLDVIKHTFCGHIVGIVHVGRGRARG